VATIAGSVVPRGDEADLYRRHHHDLVRSVARAVNASRELIEDACQSAWLILLRRQPDRGPTLFGWLRVVAIHEAYRLSRGERRELRLEDLGDHADELLGGWLVLENAVEARRALGVVAGLPEREREYLSLLVAGFSYREIGELAGGRTLSNVNRYLARARAHVRARAS
jgi:RNA polymerase sigma factor (sigma-70 family)